MVPQAVEMLAPEKESIRRRGEMFGLDFQEADVDGCTG